MVRCHFRSGVAGLAFLEAVGWDLGRYLGCPCRRAGRGIFWATGVETWLSRMGIVLWARLYLVEQVSRRI